MASAYRDGNGKGAPSFHGWVVVVDGGGDLVGRIRCDDPGDLLLAEKRVRQEMTEDVTPSVTLAPVYRMTAQFVHIDGAPQRIRTMHTLEAALDLGKNARLPFHVMLTRFAFLSELDEESRIALQRKIDDVERISTAARSNILIAR
jgi:hypothetical protein